VQRPAFTVFANKIKLTQRRKGAKELPIRRSGSWGELLVFSCESQQDFPRRIAVSAPLRELCFELFACISPSIVAG
jgi:hypothetical protein